VLDEIGAGTMPRLVVLNKADTSNRDELVGLGRRLGEVFVVSARTGKGIDALIAAIAYRIPPQRTLIEALVPYDRSDLLARVHREGEVLKSEARPDGIWVLANVDHAALAALGPYMDGSSRIRTPSPRSPEERGSKRSAEHIDGVVLND
jgi:GTP-binding protein HflX